jgi:hypothetical protein
MSEKLARAYCDYINSLELVSRTVSEIDDLADGGALFEVLGQV